MNRKGIIKLFEIFLNNIQIIIIILFS